MILTWPSASTVDSAKRLVLLMPLLKVPTLSIRRKLTRLVGILYWSICSELDSIVYAIELNFKFCCRSFFMTKRSCLRMVIVGKLRLQRTSDLKAFTVNACWLILPELVLWVSWAFEFVKIKKICARSFQILCILDFVVMYCCLFNLLLAAATFSNATKFPFVKSFRNGQMYTFLTILF